MNEVLDDEDLVPSDAPDGVIAPQSQNSSARKSEEEVCDKADDVVDGSTDALLKNDFSSTARRSRIARRDSPRDQFLLVSVSSHVAQTFLSVLVWSEFTF